ncbi:MAG: hypothetical protein IJX47_07550 [Clostridia bacterium]|nr:hypothetical protein [Clostridia bacterium]
MNSVLADMAFKIDTEAFLDSLPTMGLGMLGIFIVTGIIVLTIAALNFFTKPRKKDN